MWDVAQFGMNTAKSEGEVYRSRDRMAKMAGDNQVTT